jgi:hypothetical protein
MRTKIILAILFCAVMFATCKKDNETTICDVDFQKVQDTATVAFANRYISECPQGKYVDDFKSLVERKKFTDCRTKFKTALDNNNLSLYKEALSAYQNFTKDYPKSKLSLTGTLKIRIYNMISDQPELTAVPYIAYGITDDSTKIYQEGWINFVVLDKDNNNSESGTVIDFLVNYKYSVTKLHQGDANSIMYDDFTITNLIPGVYGLLIKTSTNKQAFLNQLKTIVPNDTIEYQSALIQK